MSLQVNVKDLLSNLYHNRGVVELLFGQRDQITVNELLGREDITEEQYRKLISLDILTEYENIVSLNDSVVAMFEDFMEIGEVTPGFINDYIYELKRHINFYQEAREMRFLRSIKKYLKRINATLTREIIKLQKNVDDTYKNESNYRIKLQKLEDYREKRDTIIDFIKKTKEIVDETRVLFNITNDTELFGIIAALKVSLIENLDFLIEIQTDITDFINKIQFQLDVYKKAQRLKEVKDHGTLHFKTNFREIVGSINTLKHNGHKTPKTKIPIDFLYSDDGHVLCKRIAEKYKITRLMVRGLADKMAGNFKDKGLEQQIKLDTEKLVERFLTQTKHNLFEYLIEYKFPKAIGHVSFEERLSLFVEIAMEYQTELDFKYRLQYHDYEDASKNKKRLGYTLILPLKDKPVAKKTKVAEVKKETNGTKEMEEAKDVDVLEEIEETNETEDIKVTKGIEETQEAKEVVDVKEIEESKVDNVEASKPKKGKKTKADKKVKESDETKESGGNEEIKGTEEAEGNSETKD